MIVIAKGVGRLANRLLLFAHFIGTAAEHGLTVVNPWFGPYARYFPATAGDLLCRYPARTSRLRGGRASRYLAMKASWGAADVLHRLQNHGKDVGLIRLRRDQALDLGSEQFLQVVRRHRVVFVQDWFFRSGTNCARHVDVIRAFFTPWPSHLAAASRTIARARAKGRFIVGVHVRHGDYQRAFDGRYFYTHEQYRAALKQVESAFPNEDLAFLVCSDAAVPREAFRGLNLVYGNGHELEDLYALAACDRIVGPPSTYSAWASYYGDVPLYVLENPEAAVDPAFFRVRTELSWGRLAPAGSHRAPLRGSTSSSSSAELLDTSGLGFDLAAHERARVVDAADRYLEEPPVTITATFSRRSAGGRHDFFSEGDYWWPDPARPNGPYVRRDGLTNPDNFVDHRRALIGFSVRMPGLTAAWLLTGEARYADHAARHLRAWFLDPVTLMNPHLRYAQAVRGRCSGRSFGVIDTVHLVEVARAAAVLEVSGAISVAERTGVRAWFREYLTWLTTHEYGVTEREAPNNHGTCWVVQAAEFARYTGDEAVLEDCRERYKNVLLPTQIASDGSFPRELARTKPYAYSLFNVDAMAMVCQILSTGGDELWTYELADGRGMRRALEFIYPFILDKSPWPYGRDAACYENWPVRHPSLLFGGLALGRPEYVALWRQLDPDPLVEEVIRSYPFRQPAVWGSSSAGGNESALQLG